MIGVDTNVLIRFFIEDEPKQAELARQLLLKAKQQNAQILINAVVLCELVWVLESGYCYAKTDIISLIQKILSTKQFEIPNKKIVWRALDDYRSGPFDFSDCIIGQINQDRGVSETVSFDKALKKLGHFRVI